MYKGFLLVALVNFCVCNFSYGQTDTLLNKNFIDELLITIKPIKNQSVRESTPITQQFKESKLGDNIADLFSNTAGVSVRRTGNVAKPIIDGLGSSRVLYLTYGVRLENQDWADQHGPEINTFFSKNIKLERSAETVRYGANALGGVIKIDNPKIQDSVDFKGAYSTAFLSNTRGIKQHLLVEKRVKKLPSLSFRTQFSWSKEGDYHTSKYNIGNTGVRDKDFYTEINYSSIPFDVQFLYLNQNQRKGSFYGALSGNIEELEEIIALGRPAKTIPFSYAIQAPYQHIKHQLLLSKAQWKLQKSMSINAIYALQKNHRQEYEVRRMDRTTIPSQDTDLQSHFAELSLKYTKNNWKGEIGLAYRRKENFNQPGTGVVPAIPNYDFQTKSAFLLGGSTIKNWYIDYGIRYDQTYMNALGINFLGIAYGQAKQYNNWSSQIGGKYNFKNGSFSSAISYGNRVPEPYELFVNGKQHGLPIFFIGDKNIKPEVGIKWFNHLTYYVGKSKFQVNAFYHHFDNFIYTVPTQTYKQLFSGPAVIFNFQQSRAVLMGIDWGFERPITYRVFLKTQWSAIRATAEGHKYLPNISPLKGTTTIDYTWPNEKYQIGLEHQYTAKKKKFSEDYELSKDTPAASSLYNLIGRLNFKISNQTLSVILRIDNVLNTEYKDYMDYHRYFIHAKGRDIRLNIVYNF